MQIILLERIDKLGMMGQVVDVKPGFARNYLLPQKKALRATEENIAFFEKQRVDLEAKNLKAKSDAEFVATKLDNVSIILIRQAGETGQLYGSVSARDIADAIQTEVKINISKAQVLIHQPIKTLGQHLIQVALHPEVRVNVTATIALSTDEAKLMVEKAKKPTQE
ncbi:MAG: 50S ribosomal protein L9 [Alphaproteobacteria bacterium]|nr:50S ribosomal protein L9 [Alphaproteobacteria bacterium]OJV46476.1 MAG: 50S ribosomal protein L9 [Alphaproteobacteria bacterium 43-37]